jgi:hypothetical protein
MFDISKNIKIQIQIFNGSKIFIIENFYEDPNCILNFLSKTTPDLWKKEEDPTHNGIFFEDRRHELYSADMVKVYNFLSSLCKQTPQNNNDWGIYTNCITFKKCKFNDYVNNYWCPHYDSGYNAVIYLNNDDEDCGTNFYENISLDDEIFGDNEHFMPWIKKSKLKVIKSIRPKFNKLVLFDGNKFLHGMNICNDFYFGKNNYRLNQVLFFI